MGAPVKPTLLTKEDLEGWYAEVLASNSHLKGRTARYMGHPSGRMEFSIPTIYGLLRITQMFDPKSGPMSMQPHLSLVPAHVVLPVVFENGTPFVIMNKRWREGVAEPELYMPAWEKGKTVDPAQIFEYLGKEYLEIPRGGLDPSPDGNGLMSAREAAEELAMDVESVVDLGFIQQDGAWVMTPPKYLLAVMGKENAGLLDEYETRSFTKGKVWVPARDLSKPEWDTDDGITLASFRRAQTRIPYLAKADFVNRQDWENKELRYNLGLLVDALKQ